MATVSGTPAGRRQVRGQDGAVPAAAAAVTVTLLPGVVSASDCSSIRPHRKAWTNVRLVCWFRLRPAPPPRRPGVIGFHRVAGRAPFTVADTTFPGVGGRFVRV